MVPDKSLLIAFVSNNAWSVYNFRIDVIRSMLASGHSVLVISPPDEYISHLEEAGCRHISIPFDNRSTNPLADLKLFLRLKQLYATHRPDLIFHYVAKPNIYGTMAAGALKIPSVAVVTGLGYVFSKHNFLYHIVRRLYRHALRKATEVWFLNNEDARVFSSEKIVSIEKIKVLPGEGVNTGFFSPQPAEKPQTKTFRFLMACRLLKSKGIAVYADACRILRRKHYHFESVLIGFEEAHHPDAIAPADLKKWEVEGLLQYHGFASDVRPELSAADCFIFPSYYNEGVPRSLMEAASMELPVITSRSRGCREVVLDQITGFLCQPGDPFDLADKMEQILLMPEAARKHMGQKGRELVVSTFDINRIIAEYHSVINTITQ